MLHSTLEKKIVITIGLFAGVSLLIVLAVILPTVANIRAMDRDTYNLRLTLERKNEQAINYRMAIKQIDNLKKEMPVFNEHLFFAGDELKLITTLENLATKHGINQRIINSSLDNITNQKILISLAITGSYAHSLAYLDDLEHLPYFINVVKFSMTPFSDRNNPGITDNVVMNLDLNLYVIP
jgi:Tfp pilus assembly protein PilO